MHMCNFLFNEGTSWYDTLGNDPWSCEPVGFGCHRLILSIGQLMDRVHEILCPGHPSHLPVNSLVWPSQSKHGGYSFSLTWLLCYLIVAHSSVLAQETLPCVDFQRCLHAFDSCDWLLTFLQNPHGKVLTLFLTPAMMISKVELWDIIKSLGSKSNEYDWCFYIEFPKSSLAFFLVLGKQ